MPTPALASALCSLGAQAQETFKVGIVSFLSGQAAESFGIPAVNGAKVLLDAFNKGAAPAPYNKPGFGGMKLEFVYVDEAGGATKQVQELKTLYDREKVDAVLGYVSSGDCLAVAPAAEEMKKFLLLYDCGTPRIFEPDIRAYAAPAGGARPLRPHGVAVRREGGSVASGAGGNRRAASHAAHHV